MRVGKKVFFITLLFISMVLFFLVHVKVVKATSCSSNADCYPGYCSLLDHTCVNTCGNNNCESAYGETSSNCCLDCGCPSGQTCELSGGSYSCVASYEPNGVCEYGKGERIGDSTRLINGKLVDDCDQDGDGKYDSCGLLT